MPDRISASCGGSWYGTNMADAQIGDVRIHYTESGTGDPLLLIMGFGMPGDAWLGSLPFLQDFHAIYFDNRGHHAGAVRPDEARQRAGERALDLHHVHHRDAL